MSSDQKKLVPKLRFPGFEGEWKEKSLSELCSFIKDGSHGSHDDTKGGGYLLLSAKNIKNGKINIDESDREISEEEYRSIFRNYALKRDDILLSIVGTIGNVALFKQGKNVAFQRSVAFFRLKIDLPQYVYYYFCSELFQKELLRRQVVSAQPGVYLGDLSKITIRLPELLEQKESAEFLSSVDEWIENLEGQREKLEEYKKGMMQKIFSQEIRFKDNTDNDFPEWSQKKLKDIFKKKTKKNTHNSVNFVLTNSATEGIVSQEAYFDRDIANQNNLSNYYVVDLDDFVYNPRISKYAPVGPLKRNKLQKGAMSPLYTVLKLTLGNKEFYEKYFETAYWHRYMKKIANYGARHDRMNILQDDFLNMPVPWPTLEEQNKIAKFLADLDKLFAIKQLELKNAKKWKKGLLQQMFV